MFSENRLNGIFENPKVQNQCTKNYYFSNFINVVRLMEMEYTKILWINPICFICCPVLFGVRLEIINLQLRFLVLLPAKRHWFVFNKFFFKGKKIKEDLKIIFLWKVWRERYFWRRLWNFLGFVWFYYSSFFNHALVIPNGCKVNYINLQHM